MPRVSSLGLLVAAAVTTLSACNTPPSGSACAIGQPVTIPSSDSSPPAVAVDFFLPDGRTISMTSGSPAQIITSASSGTVTVIAKATVPQGSQDVQVWAGERRCTSSAGTTSCSGPGLLGAPSASNPNTGTPGMAACTERLVSHNVQILNNSTRDISQEISIVGKNFAGQQTTLGIFTLRAQ